MNKITTVALLTKVTQHADASSAQAIGVRLDCYASQSYVWCVPSQTTNGKAHAALLCHYRL